MPRSCIASLLITRSAGDDAIGQICKTISYLEFGILVIGNCLRFGYWCLEFTESSLYQLITCLNDGALKTA